MMRSDIPWFVPPVKARSPHGMRSRPTPACPTARSRLRPHPTRQSVIRKNYGNDVLPEANYAVLGRRCYSVREYLRVDKL
jgi:hypothetical protein